MDRRLTDAYFDPIRVYFGTNLISYALVVPVDQATEPSASLLQFCAAGGHILHLYGSHGQIVEDVRQNLGKEFLKKKS